VKKKTRIKPMTKIKRYLRVQKRRVVFAILLELAIKRGMVRRAYKTDAMDCSA
jgi:hypothetical protein